MLPRLLLAQIKSITGKNHETKSCTINVNLNHVSFAISTCRVC